MAKTTHVLGENPPPPQLQFFKRGDYLIARYEGVELAKVPLRVGEERLIDWQNTVATTISQAHTHDPRFAPKCTRS